MRYRAIKIPAKCMEKYKLTNQYAKFKWVRKLIEYDEKFEKGIAKHLNRKMCLDYTKHKQMDVKSAMLIFNSKTADSIEWMVKNESWADEARTTAVYCRLWARWYQIMGAYNRQDGFDTEKPVERQEKIDFLIFFMDFYANCIYIGTKNQLSLWGNQKHVLCSTWTVIWLQGILLEQDDFGFFLPGYILGNSVENLHQDVRHINPLPTGQIYMKILRGISMTQLFGESVRGASYELDHGKNWLVSLSDHKKLLEANPKDKANIEFFDDNELVGQDYHEEVANSFIGGAVLGKVLENPDCTTCLDFWKETSETADNPLNSLIEARETVIDGYFRPSDVGHKILQYADRLFVRNRDLEIDKKGLVDAFINFLFERINTRFEDIPGCHFYAIVKKLVTWKWYHYAKYLNTDLTEINKDEIANEMNASKTTKAWAILNADTGPKIPDWQDPAQWQKLVDELPSFQEGDNHENDESQVGKDQRDDISEMDLDDFDYDECFGDDDRDDVSNESFGEHDRDNVSNRTDGPVIVNRLDMADSQGFLDDFPIETEMADGQDKELETAGYNVSVRAEDPEIVDTMTDMPIERAQSFATASDFVELASQMD